MFRELAAKRENGKALLRAILGLTRSQWETLHNGALSLSYCGDDAERDYVNNFLDLLELELIR